MELVGGAWRWVHGLVIPILEMTESEAEALLSEDFILRIIESEDITVEVQKETDEEITKVRFLYQTYILPFATSSCYA